MRLLIATVCFFSLLFSAYSNAESTLIRAKHFNIIKKLIRNDTDTSHTLLVMDDDDTLTKMPCSSNQCQYIGGPAWYAWQSSLPKNNAMRVARNTQGLIAANDLILTASRMPLVEPTIPNVLNDAKIHKIHLLVATARGSDLLNATEAQLKKDHIFSTIKADSIKTPAGLSSIAGPYTPKDGSRAVLYQNGVLYLAGQNKGIMLQDFLNKTKNNQFTHIIFIDDTLKNVQQVVAAYAKTPNIQVTGIYYTHLKSHKAAFAHGPKAKKLQTLATQRWRKIDSQLHHDLPGFNINS